MLEDKTKDELIHMVESLQNELKRTKRYGLVWERSKVKEELDTKFENGAYPTLQYNQERSFQTGKNELNHILIEGDNFHALSVLQYTHKEKVDVVIIDPPYNTGNKDFFYIDDYVDKEDTWRHSKWLSFMEKRLILAKELLKDSGVIFIHIDDNEFAQLKLLCDSIFSEGNLVANLIWRKKSGGGNDSKLIVTEHEYILVYSKNKKINDNWYIPYNSDYLKRYKHEDTTGLYFWDTMARAGLEQKPINELPDSSMIYKIIAPDGMEIRNRWIYSKKTYLEEVEKGNVRIIQTKKGDWSVQFKQRIGVGKKPRTIMNELPSNTEASKEIAEILGKKTFNYAKPVGLIKYLLSFSTSKNSIILDFFAGSGTTGQAVLELNNDDGGNRQYILCTNNEVDEKTKKSLEKEGKTREEIEEYGICRSVTYQRLQKVMKGFERFEALGGNLHYFQTDFVEKSTHEVEMKKRMIRHCEGLIQLKESVFDVVVQAQRYGIYRNANKVVAIHTHPLGNQNENEIKEQLIMYQGCEKVYYYYNPTPYPYERDEQLIDIIMKPIPQDILEILQEWERKLKLLEMRG